MRKFWLSIESKVECNQKMKLPQGLNNLQGRINHPAAEKRASESLLFPFFTKELFLTGLGASYKPEGLAIPMAFSERCFGGWLGRIDVYLGADLSIRSRRGRAPYKGQ